MRLTSFTDFALRALMRLAGEPGRSFATNELAAAFRISRNHLPKTGRQRCSKRRDAAAARRGRWLRHCVQKRLRERGKLTGAFATCMGRARERRG